VNSSTDDSDAFWQQIYQREEAEYNPNQDTDSWDILAPKKTDCDSGNNGSEKKNQQPNSQDSIRKQLQQLSTRECGAMWNKEDRNGNPWFNGQIDIDGKMTRFRVLPNLNQDEENNTPHWRLFWIF